MRFNRIIFLFFVTLTVTLNSFGQGRQLKKADVAFEQYEFAKAMDYYKRAYSKSSDIVQKIGISFRLAECARKIGNYRQAESYYKRTIKMRYDDPIAIYYLGMMQRNIASNKTAAKAVSKYQEAIKSFQQYQEKVPEDLRAQEAIVACELAIDWTENPSRYAVTNMKKINSKFDDRMPCFGDKKQTSLYFTTARKGVNGRKLSAQTGQYFTDIWVTEIEKQKKKKKGKKSKPRWKEPLSYGDYKGIDDPISTKFDEGAVTFDDKFKVMYFNRSIMKKRESHSPRVYQFEQKGNDGSEAVEINIPVDSNYMVIHPCIVENGKVLYFASDMPGGYGDLDIWKSEYNKREDSWGEPENLGPEVNTDDQEMTPFLHKNGTLYFASKGHIGMGGFDIFRATKRPSGQYGKVKNMKFPINSSYDDFGIVFSGNDAISGFFTSNRKGGRGGDDIYETKLADLEFVMEGVLTDLETNEPLQGVSVHIEGSDGNSFDAITNKSGFFEFGDEVIKQGVEYDVTYEKEPYIPLSDTVTTQNLTIHDFEVTDEGFLYTISVDLAMKVYRLPIVLPRIEYDLGSSALRDLAMKDLDHLVEVLETNPDLRIQLRSHTDFRSSDEFNKDLSLKRAQACVDYLIQNGIDESRLEPVGMGESEPLILTEDRNGFMKGDKFTKEFIEGLSSRRKRELAHQMNRRTDFKQIESDPEDAKLYGEY